MKISGDTSEVTNDTAVSLAQQRAVAEKKSTSQLPSSEAAVKSVHDQVRLSGLLNDIKASVDPEQFKVERERRKEEVRARVAAGDYFVSTDVLKVKFLEGLDEHNAFMLGSGSFSDSDKGTGDS